MSRTDTQGTSYEAFARTMKRHPERLKGKSVDAAYQGMRRQVAHLESTVPGNSNSARGVQGPVARKTAWNGNDGGTVQGAKKAAKPVGSDLLGGKNATMGPAIERRLNKSSRSRPRNNGDVVDEKIGKAAKKVMQTLGRSGRGSF